MTRLKWILTSLVIIVLSSTLLAQDEPTEDFVILESGQEIEAVFEDNVTAILFAFNGTEGDTISIHMTQGANSDLDPYLVLLGSAGQVYAADDDSGEVAFSALISNFELPQSGTYLVLASTFQYIDPYQVVNLDEPLEFTLLLTGATEPTVSETDEDGITLITSLIEYGDSIGGISTAEEPVFYFQFQASAGDVIDILLRTSDFQTAVHLFNKEGHRLMLDYTQITNFELEDAGTYTIFATDALFYLATESNISTAGLEFKGGSFSLFLDNN